MGKHNGYFSEIFTNIFLLESIYKFFKYSGYSLNKNENVELLKRVL